MERQGAMPPHAHTLGGTWWTRRHEAEGRTGLLQGPVLCF